MTFTPYQIVVPILSILAILYAWSLFRRQKKTLWEVTLWAVFWVMIAVIAVFPATLEFLSLVTGIKDNENAALITSIGLLFFIVFYLVMRIESLEQRQTRLVRKLALKEVEEGEVVE